MKLSLVRNKSIFLILLSCVILSVCVFKFSQNSLQSQPIIVVCTTPEPKKKLLPLCQDPSPKLIGHLDVNLTDAPSFEQIAKENAQVKQGGQFQPQDCVSAHPRLAIVVPFRDRKLHLRIFLHHIHPILQRQLLNYRIFVVEQAGDNVFNKALLMNVGFKESLTFTDPEQLESQFQCYIFHDVDLVSENDRGLYACGSLPLHISEFLRHLGYEPYAYVDVLFGGIVAVPRRHFELVNGYSNVYFGWGAEDEDMRARFRALGITVDKVHNNETYRYQMISHSGDKGNPRNERRVDFLGWAAARMHKDGLNSLTYKLLRRSELPLYTHLLVEFEQEQVLLASIGRKTLAED